MTQVTKEVTTAVELLCQTTAYAARLNGCNINLNEKCINYSILSLVLVERDEVRMFDRGFKM